MTSQYRHRRTSIPSVVFPTLEPGEIAVNTANRQIALGDAASGVVGAPLNLLAVRIFDVRAQYAAGDYVVQAGVLYRAKVPISPGAFNVANWDMLVGQVDPQYVAVAGDQMTGPLELPAANPTLPVQAAHKGYVDTMLAAKSSVIVSGTPPTPTPIDSTLWYDTIGGQLYIRYNDGSTTQWVIAAPQPNTDQFVSSYLSDAPPADAPDNSLWMESDTGITYFRWNDGTSAQWVSLVAGTAPLDSPVFTGNPRAPTPTAGDNDTSIATTAFVQAAFAAVPISAGAWTPYTATYSGGTAAVTVANSRYTQIGKTVIFVGTLTVTVAGTIGLIGLPFMSAAGSLSGFAMGRETMINGLGWGQQINGASTGFTLNVTANNGGQLAVGEIIKYLGVYERA
jgi:hypothetical protein